MQQGPPIIDYEAPQAGGRPVSMSSALLSCLPGMIAPVIYVVSQYREVPLLIGYLYWPLFVIGVVLSFFWHIRLRDGYRAGHRPWFVTLSMAIHTFILMVGVLLLLIAFLALAARMGSR